MKKFEDDIEDWITNKFPDAQRAKEIIEPLLEIDTAVNRSRIIRCALYLSDNDYDSLVNYTSKALDDPRNVLWWAEYDSRNIQKRDFNYSFNKQKT
ncbi:hypothetical protein [Thalassotalea montiporae]